MTVIFLYKGNTHASLPRGPAIFINKRIIKLFPGVTVVPWVERIRPRKAVYLESVCISAEFGVQIIETKQCDLAELVRRLFISEILGCLAPRSCCRALSA